MKPKKKIFILALAAFIATAGFLSCQKKDDAGSTIAMTDLIPSVAIASPMAPKSVRFRDEEIKTQAEVKAEISEVLEKDNAIACLTGITIAPVLAPAVTCYGPTLVYADYPGGGDSLMGCG